MSNQTPDRQNMKRALEALRSGVPNRDAVQILGCDQEVVIDRFRAQLSGVDGDTAASNEQKGMLIAGAFGSGKSHVLEYLKHIALDGNFICSHIVIGKSTPLYDQAKLFAAAVESAVAPAIMGDAIKEIALHLRTDTPTYTDWYLWANSEASEMSQIFPATMLLHERLSNDPEMSDKIRDFWAGEKLAIAEIRAGMKQIGQSATFQLKAVPAKQLPLQRFQFVSKMIRAAGYRGWVLLLDEVELIGTYSRIQRGRSYGELARWLGQVESDQYPAITAVAAITDDFALGVLDQKDDRHVLIPTLESRNTDEYRGYASRAETGMRIIDHEGVVLKNPNQVTMDRTYETLKNAHGQAYDWDIGDIPRPVISVTRPMRQHVRRLINEWDLRRLYPDHVPDIEETPLSFDYAEDSDFEKDSEASNDQSGAE